MSVLNFNVLQRWWDNIVLKNFQSAILGAKTITANGTYAASSDELDGFSSVTVNVTNADYTAAFTALGAEAGSGTTPLTDAIEALTDYSNETTGESDANLSAAVATLVAGFGGSSVVSGTFEIGEGAGTTTISTTDWTQEVDVSAYSGTPNFFCAFNAETGNTYTAAHFCVFYGSDYSNMAAAGGATQGEGVAMTNAAAQYVKYADGTVTLHLGQWKVIKNGTWYWFAI